MDTSITFEYMQIIQIIVLSSFIGYGIHSRMTNRTKRNNDLLEAVKERIEDKIEKDKERYGFAFEEKEAERAVSRTYRWNRKLERLKKRHERALKKTEELEAANKRHEISLENEGSGGGETGAGATDEKSSSDHDKSPSPSTADKTTIEDSIYRNM